MLQRPQFKPQFHVETIKGEGVFLLSEAGAVVLHGRLPQLVAPLINGRRSVDEVVDELALHASAAEVYYAFLELERMGYLVEDALPLNRCEAAWWFAQGVDPWTAWSRLAEARVAVSAIGDVAVESFRSALRSLRVTVGDVGQLLVVITDDYLRGALQAINKDALQSGRPWLLVKPVGSILWLGPLFRPGITACWACLAQRLRANRPVETHLRARTGRTEVLPVSLGWSPSTLNVTLNLAAGEVARWVVRGKSEFEGAVVTLDIRSGKTRTHVVVRRPQCPTCGNRSAGRPPVGPVALHSRRKVLTRGGGHRAVRPDETLARYQHHVSPITGAVTLLERLAPGVDVPISAFGSAHGLGTAQDSLNVLRGELLRSCGGKGVTGLQAQVSGLCEALERYSAGFTGDEPRRRAALCDMGAEAVHPDSYTLFSDRQYRERHRWNARRSHYCLVPPPFDPNAPIDWSPLWSLTRREVRYLPTGLLYFGYPSRTEEEDYVQTSNGLATGNNLEEAILQGFLELVERDSCAVWWYNRVHRPAVDWRSFDNWESFDEDYVQRIAGFLETRGRSLWMLDLTNDLQLPTFVALSRRLDDGPERILLGFGAHLDAGVALLRAVTELTQMFTWLLTAKDEEQVPDGQMAPITADWLRTATLANQPYLVPDQDTPARRASDFTRLWSDDLVEDLRFCQSLVEQHGMEMLVLDLTQPDVGLPAVKVVVPGLRPHWARLAPGRLYDVPVQLGWLAQPLLEEQLNPMPMFL
jgi:bacteriocin biosynthesis cyclodehydratase domain-containing protein